MKPLNLNVVARNYSKLRTDYQFGSVFDASEVVCDVLNGYESKIDDIKPGKSSSVFSYPYGIG